MRRHLSTAKTTVLRQTTHPTSRRRDLLHERLDDLFPIALSQNWQERTELWDSRRVSKALSFERRVCPALCDIG